MIFILDNIIVKVKIETKSVDADLFLEFDGVVFRISLTTILYTFKTKVVRFIIII